MGGARKPPARPGPLQGPAGPWKQQARGSEPAASTKRRGRGRPAPLCRRARGADGKAGDRLSAAAPAEAPWARGDEGPHPTL